VKLPPAPLRIKICGITRVEDAVLAADAGADMIGLNFVPTSARRVDVAVARAIADAVRGRVTVIGVVADEEETNLRALVQAVGLDRLQLHGHEPPALVLALAPLAFQALRVAGAEDVPRALAWPGDLLLVDASVPGQLGGTGVRVDPAIAAAIATERAVLLAGGLRPDNVAEAVLAARPWGVDVASGVEARPGIKDPDKVLAFVQAARAASASLLDQAP
jgi:phosphoribosylanthranilate isomerase